MIGDIILRKSNPLAIQKKLKKTASQVLTRAASKRDQKLSGARWVILPQNYLRRIGQN